MMPALTTGEQDAVIVLAGRAAERRAQRPDSQGFRRWPTMHFQTCLHEAAHVVVAAALGQFPQWAVVSEPRVADDKVIRSGRAHIGASPEQGANTEPSLEGNGKIQSDFEKASEFCKFVTGGRGWLSYMRTLSQKADAILEARWPAVKILAQELEQKGVVRRADIEDVLRRWPIQE